MQRKITHQQITANYFKIMKKLFFSACVLSAIVMGLSSCDNNEIAYDGIEMKNIDAVYFGPMSEDSTASHNIVLTFYSADFASVGDSATAGMFQVIDLNSAPYRKIEEKMLPKEGTYKVVKNIKYEANTVTYGKKEYIESGIGSYGYDVKTNTPYLWTGGTVDIKKSGDNYTIECMLTTDAGLYLKFRYIGKILPKDGRAMMGIVKPEQKLFKSTSLNHLPYGLPFKK